MAEKKKNEIDPDINLKLVISCALKRLGDNDKLPKAISKQSHRTIKMARQQPLPMMLLREPTPLGLRGFTL